MNAKKTTGLWAALGAAMLFAGCSDISSGGSSDNGGTAYSGGAYIKVVDSSQTLRVAVPHYALSNFDTFTLYSIKASATDTVQPLPTAWDADKNSNCKVLAEDVSYDEITGLIAIPSDTYWFKLEAKENNSDYHNTSTAKTIFSAVTDKPVTIEEGLVELEFTLFPVKYSTVGKGNFRVKLTLPSVVKDVIATLTPFDNENGKLTSASPSSFDGSLTFSFSGGVALYEGTSVTAGVYVATFVMKNDVGNEIGTWEEFVVISTNKTSSSEATISAIGVSIEDRIKDKPDTVGDIVLSNGRAIGYDDSVTADKILAAFGNNATKSTITGAYPIGVVFYTGYSSVDQTKEEYALGDRILVVSRLSSDTALQWAADSSDEAKGFVDECVTDSPSASAKRVYTYGSTKYAGKSDSALDGHKVFDSLFPVDAESGIAPAIKDYPAFHFAHNGCTGNLNNDNSKFDYKLAGASAYTGTLSGKKAYLPSVVELLELHKNRKAVRPALEALSGLNLYSNNGYKHLTLDERYWSCSQYATVDAEAWSVGFSDNNTADVAQHSPKIPDDEDDLCYVLGVLEYSCNN